MDIQRIAAFSKGHEGGNPAGVVLLDTSIGEEEMVRVAAEVGYSETVFAVPLDASGKKWRVRYFSPETEVPFCGHATIALGTVLGKQVGWGTFELTLNDAVITVDAHRSETGVVATLTSPPTNSQAVPDALLTEVLSLFGFRQADLDDRLPPARIHGGSDHIVLLLSDRTRLAGMTYDLSLGRDVMRRLGVATIMLVVVKDDQTFVVRNAFASGGVLEDPATGAAAAAFGGYLRDRNWPHRGRFTIRQGEDMGQPSLIGVELDNTPGSPVRVSGGTRRI
ncbi:putative isomerase YddE [Aliiroseovarius pelagivivens]|uniref:Putative isomerase YddE n=1 Tax=Aliiroseovarius pelagivivens TaxID=1639690 RepID=A0A2R8AIY5_9RHOB|nr:PhzF family phenazine biosynthesis protein [Aliiroseovarius pelagivivens]SPF76001.1 putative isomerase YddE [Aliiroseovarius pelagivivens]